MDREVTTVDLGCSRRADSELIGYSKPFDLIHYYQFIVLQGCWLLLAPADVAHATLHFRAQYTR